MKRLLIESIPGDVLSFALSIARSNSARVKSRSKCSRSSLDILHATTEGWLATSPKKLSIPSGGK